jgi:hypothetical protein
MVEILMGLLVRSTVGKPSTKQISHLKSRCSGTSTRFNGAGRILLKLILSWGLDICALTLIFLKTLKLELNLKLMNIIARQSQSTELENVSVILM